MRMLQAMGLSLINNTNLNYFKNAHKAEMFKLKGMLYEAQEDIENANQLFFTSLDLKDDEAAAWLCWGRLCAARYDRKLSDAAKAREAARVQGVPPNEELVRLCSSSSSRSGRAMTSTAPFVDFVDAACERCALQSKRTKHRMLDCAGKQLSVDESCKRQSEPLYGR